MLPTQTALCWRRRDIRRFTFLRYMFDAIRLTAALRNGSGARKRAEREEECRAFEERKMQASAYQATPSPNVPAIHQSGELML